MAEPPVFRKEWVVQIKNLIANNGGENCSANKDAIPRVATPLLKMKREAYIPQFLSIGPYHHSTLDKDIHDSSSCAEQNISRAEMCKGKAAARLSQKLSERGKSFDKSILELMEQMRPEIDRYYDLPTSTGTKEYQYSKHFSLMMAVDSSFPLDFLIRLFDEEMPADDRRPASTSTSSCSSTSSSTSSSSSSYPNPSSEGVMMELGPLQLCIKCDILKLENQIPLCVMKRIFEKAKKALPCDGRLKDFDNDFLKKTCQVLSPFAVSDGRERIHRLNDTVTTQPHLLGCMHAFVSPFLQIKAEKNNPSVLQMLKKCLDIPGMVIRVFGRSPTTAEKDATTAEKLASAGIDFKSSDKIHFDSYSGTLHLPRINVWEKLTEVLLRNMVAWEFSDVSRGITVMRYVSLMDALIQTRNDVRVLKDRGVIETNTLTEESIASMWNDLGQPFFTGHLELGRHSDEFGRQLFYVIQRNDVKSKINSVLRGIYKDYVANWKFIAVLAGFLGLAMTAIQTYCSWYSLYLLRSATDAPKILDMHLGL